MLSIFGTSWKAVFWEKGFSNGKWHYCRITASEHDKFSQLFRQQIADIDGRLSILQDAEDNYYITAKYVLEVANRAYDLFKSSEVEEKRQLIKLVLSNPRVDGKKVRFEAQKPFNQILNFADRQDWLLG